MTEVMNIILHDGWERYLFIGCRPDLCMQSLGKSAPICLQETFLLGSIKILYLKNGPTKAILKGFKM